MSQSSSSNSSQSSLMLSSPDSEQPPATPPNLHQNTTHPTSKWLVQKYGGTSVGKFPLKIAQDIVSNYIDQHKVAVVCSARSGSTKSLGTTSLLLQAASEALKRSPRNGVTPGAMSPMAGRISTQKGTMSPPECSECPSPLPRMHISRSVSPAGRPALTNLTPIQSDKTVPEFYATVDLIRLEHLNAAKASVRDPEILNDLEAEIEKDCEWLRSFLFAAKVINEISPRSKDSIVGLGERMACKIMAAVLRDQGIDAEYVSLENIVPAVDDGDELADQTLDQAFYDRLAFALAERISQCSSRVPVVTGFFGPVPGSLLSQIGRGYTDLLSAVLSVGLQAAELQIWKEVDGIFTADPRKVPTARLIPVISPDEAAELTYYGSEVVHPFAMEQVIREMIPIRIKNVRNPNGGGTVIYPDCDTGVTSIPSECHPTSGFLGPESFASPLQFVHGDEHKKRKLPTAVTIKEHMIVLNVNSNRKSVSHGFLAGIFGTLDRFGVVVDLISTSEVHISMAIEGSLSKKNLDRLVGDLKKSGEVSVHHEMAILSLVGKHMRNLLGIAGRMFTTLADGNVNIEMISQGASEINISCVIEGRDAVKALNLIHQSCLQIKPGGLNGWGS